MVEVVVGGFVELRVISVVFFTLNEVVSKATISVKISLAVDVDNADDDQCLIFEFQTNKTWWLHDPRVF